MRLNGPTKCSRSFDSTQKTFTPQIDSILDLSPWPDDHQRDQELIQKAIDSHEAGSYEQRFLRPDGSTGHYFSTFQGIYDDDGKLTAMRGTVQDITVRKQSEEKIEHLNEVLRAIRNVNQLITQERDRQKLLQGACDSLTETRGYSTRLDRTS